MYKTKLSIRMMIVGVLIYLHLTVCFIDAANISERRVAYAKAQAAKKSNTNNILSSYFKRDPYGPNTYAFGFEVNDKPTNNVQFRDERRYMNGSVEGSFGYVRPDGRVIVTHFFADNERGFLHDTETYEIGESHKWQAHWPTKTPNIIMQRPQNMATGEVVYDKDLHLNVKMNKIPENISQAVQQQHGIDIDEVDVQKDIINPTVLDIVNGKIPLMQQAKQPIKTKSNVNFETVNSFIPPEFPIVPFQLPERVQQTEQSENVMSKEKEKEKEHDGVEVQQQKETNVQKEKENSIQMKPSQREKYNRAKANNAEKLMNTENWRKSAYNEEAANKQQSNAQLEPPKPLTDNVNDKKQWYEQIIHDTRNDFLQNLPSLI